MHGGVNHFRILTIDDMPAIHADFRKVLCPQQTDAALDDMEAMLFGDSRRSDTPIFKLDAALQGQAGLEKLKSALAAGQPYAMAFVDMRIPPGWDGVQTIRELWKVDPDLQVVICTAYSTTSPSSCERPWH